MDVVLRSAFAFAFILLLTRVVGKRELASLQPFDLILLVVIGDLVGQGVMQSDYSITGLMLAAATMALLTVVVSYAGYRFRPLRPLLEGEPVVLVQDGEAIERNLRRERITLEEVAAGARQQGIETIEDVKWAVLETSGRISFVERAA